MRYASITAVVRPAPRAARRGGCVPWREVHELARPFGARHEQRAPCWPNRGDGTATGKLGRPSRRGSRMKRVKGDDHPWQGSHGLRPCGDNGLTAATAAGITPTVIKQGMVRLWPNGHRFVGMPTTCQRYLLAPETSIFAIRASAISR